MRGRLLSLSISSLAIAILAMGWYCLQASAQAASSGIPGVQSAGVQNAAIPAVCGGFSTVSSPNGHSTGNYLEGVAAISANDVWAVGYSTIGNTDQTLIEHWNGSVWSVVSSPNGGIANRLHGVTAVSANDVWAVGAYYNTSNIQRTLTEHWDGSSWSVVSSLNLGTSNNQLNGVASNTSNDVWAVGYYYGGVYNQTLVEHWDGSTWSTVSSPNPGTHDNYLTGVAAFGALNVWAVGYYYDTGTSLYKTVTEYWNGTTWSVVASANVVNDNNYLAGVGGSGANDIWAVGQHFGISGTNQTLVEHWNGSVWTVVTSPNVGSGDNRLYGVEALSANDAWSVGYENGSATLTEHWDGTAWTVVSSPNRGGGQDQLTGVAAVAIGDVWAVGYSSPDTLAEHWNGTGWNIASSPNAVPLQNYLNDVDAVGPNDIWAVGYSSYPGGDQTLIEHWNGTEWTVVFSPNANGGSNRLNGVASIASNDVWAAGAYYDGSLQQTLTEHWDGSSWSIVTSANAGISNNQLNSVSASSTNDVWAVGYYYSTPYNLTLIEHWNGSAWSTVASSNTSTQDNYLVGVTALGATDAWAVGYAYDTVNSLYATLIEHWNGTTWDVVTSANVSGDNNYLAGVSGSGASDVWAVGQHFGSGSNQTLAEHWNGSAWSIVASPNVGSGDNRLYGIESLGANNAWAVGYSGVQSLAEHWDGSSWNVVGSDNPGVGQNELYGITAVSANDIWAVGIGSPGTLIEHYTGACPPTATPAPTNTPAPTGTPCAINFSDVHQSDYFYTSVTYLYCHGVINGYPDGTFRPFANSTRGQMVKIVVLGFNLPLHIPSGGAHTFEDVLPGSTFFNYVETAAADSIVGGYTCGGPGEPCNPPGNRPYFRPNANVTRGQLSKIDAIAAGWTLLDPTNSTFEDVPSGSPFYRYVETAAARGVVNGYQCGGAGEPCNPPGNKPYFRPGNNATRGQISKIVYLSILSPPDR